MAAVGKGTNSSSGVVINGGRKSSSGPIAPSEPGGRLSHAQSDAASASLKCRASAGSQQSAGPRLFTHPDSSAAGYKPGSLGEWAMLNELHYDEERPDACTCWLRVQAAATVQSVRTAQNNKLLRGVLGVKVTEFGIPLTFGGNALLWNQLKSMAGMLSSFPASFGAYMHQISWWIGTLVMVFLLVATLVKLVVCRATVFIEAVDHKRNSFLFTPLLAFIVLDLSYPYTQMHHEAALQAAFYIAFVLQVTGSIAMYRPWMFDQYRGLGGLGGTQPSFLMGTVGWFFCAILAFRAGKLGFAWFSFSIGMLMYTMVVILMMQSLPAIIKTEGVRWTIFLNIAPPSVCSSAIAIAFGPSLGTESSPEFLLSCVLVQLFFVYIAIFLAVLFYLEFTLRFFPRRYIMELWAIAFPTAALASALLQGTMLPVEDELLSTLLISTWLAIAVVCLSLVITVVLSIWLLIAFWRRQPKGIFQDPLVFEMQQNLQKRLRKQCEYCAIRVELGLIQDA